VGRGPWGQRGPAQRWVRGSTCLALAVVTKGRRCQSLSSRALGRWRRCGCRFQRAVAARSPEVKKRKRSRVGLPEPRRRQQRSVKSSCCVVTSHAATPTPASWRGECRPSGWLWRTLHTGQHQGRQVLVLALIWPDTRSSRVKVKTSLCAFGICVAGVGSPTSPQRPCLSCLLWR